MFRKKPYILSYIFVSNCALVYRVSGTLVKELLNKLAHHTCRCAYLTVCNPDIIIYIDNHYEIQSRRQRGR